MLWSSLSCCWKPQDILCRYAGVCHNKPDSSTIVRSQVQVHFGITSPQLTQFHEEHLVGFPNANIDSGLTLPAQNG